MDLVVCSHGGGCYWWFALATAVLTMGMVAEALTVGF
jgi:hypothetical protein